MNGVAGRPIAYHPAMTPRTLVRSRRERVTLLALLLTVVYLGPARGREGEAERGESVGSLVDRCIDAYGGAERLRAVEGWQEVGTLVSATRGEAVMARVFAPPERLRVEIRFGDESSEVRILNGQKGWRSGKAVQGPLYVAMVLQAARLSLPRILLEGKGRLEDLGETDAPDQRVRRLGLPLRDGMRLEVEIDQKTARIVRSKSIAGPLVFETAYGDFRPVDGILFPFSETTWAMGHETGRFEIDQIALGGELGDQIFRP